MLVTYSKNTESDIQGTRKIQWHHALGSYKVPDSEVACGSTLGAPAVCTVIKASGALEKVYSIGAGQQLLGSFMLQHWDEESGCVSIRSRGIFRCSPSIKSTHSCFRTASPCERTSSR